MSVGVLTFRMYRMGDSESYIAGLSHGLPKNSNSVSPWASDDPYQLHQLLIIRSACAALNRLVFTVTQAVTVGASNNIKGWATGSYTTTALYGTDYNELTSQITTGTKVGNTSVPN